MQPVHQVPSRTLREQLRLFAFDGSDLLQQDTWQHIQQDLSYRERLSTLLEGELDFHGEDSSYASHDLHAFAAKFPPQLPRAFNRGLTDPGDLVLDPMMGSGTTVVEALLGGRRGVGFDIDPLALRLSRVKTSPLDVGHLRGVGNEILTKAHRSLTETRVIDRAISERFDQRTRSFIDYWFLPDTQRSLMALALAIEDIGDFSTRRFLNSYSLP